MAAQVPPEQVAEQREQATQPGQVPPPAGDTVLHALERAVAAIPDEVFLDFDGELLTFADVDRRSTRLAHGIAALGVGKGDTVVTVLDNNADHILTWLAVNKLGGVWVPINT